VGAVLGPYMGFVGAWFHFGLFSRLPKFLGTKKICKKSARENADNELNTI
jgi:hypothetical protein